MPSGRPKIYDKLVQTTVLVEERQDREMKNLMGLWEVTLSSLYRVAIDEFLKRVKETQHETIN